MSLDDVVNVSIVVQSSALTLPGFGVPMIAVQHSNFAERLRYYSDLSGMLDDGFLSSDPAYRMASAIFSQNPKPSRIAIGRREAAVAQVDTIEVLGNTDGTYTIQVDGVDASFVAASQTITQIRDGLVLAVNALTAKLGRSEVVAAPISTDALSITASTAGVPVSLALTAPVTGDLSFRQNVLVTGNTAGTYTITIGSIAHSYLADGVVTAAQIRDALVTAINAGSSGVAASPGTGDSLDLHAVTQFVVTVASTGSAMTLTERTLNSGLPEDLDAITEEQADWYFLLIPDRDAVSILVAAEAIETQRRMFVAQSSDAEILALPFDSGNTETDIFSKLKALSLARTIPAYASNDTNDIAAAWVGLQAPKTPASSTWKFKELRAVVVDEFTTTELVNLKSKNGNGFREIAGRNITFEGTVAEGEFADVIRGIDKLYQTIQANVFVILVRNEKIDFTNAGIATISAGVTAAIEESVSDGLIAQSRPNAITGDEETPAYTVTPPNVSDISAGDRESRIIPASNPIRFEGTLAGAIHAVSVSGTLAA